MGIVRGTVEVTINLSKSTCYFMKTGKCSLNIVSNFFLSPGAKFAPHDLLYCPRLYQAMKNKEKMKPVAITPCECGHGQVVTGQQRACIAGQKKLELTLSAAGDKVDPACSICGGQMTFDKNIGGQRIVTVRALVHNND